MLIKSAGSAVDTLRVFVPITKVDMAKGIVYGILAAEETDRADEVFDYDGSKPYFEKWSQGISKATAGKSVGNLRSMHGQVAAGKFTDMVFNDELKQIEVTAKVVDANELKKVDEGVYTGFSIGGKYAKRWKDGDVQRYIADPYEGSLVDLPCIPSATFEVVKAAGGTELRKFHVPAAVEKTAKAPTSDEVIAKARELAKAAGDEADFIPQIEKATQALLKADLPDVLDVKPTNEMPLAVTAVDDEPAAPTEAEKAAAKAAGAGAKDNAAPVLDAVQVWAHPSLPGQTFGKKSELADALTKAAADKTAASSAAPVLDLLKDVTKALDDKDGGKKKEPTDEEKAAALKDKKAKNAKAKKDALDSDMDDAEKVTAAVELYKEEPSYALRHKITKAAVALDKIDLLPVAWDVAAEDLAKAAPTPELRKAATLDAVSSLISLVSSLESFHTRITMDGSGYYYYPDGVTKIDVSEATTSKVSDLCDQLGSVAADLLDEILAAMKGAGTEATKAIGIGAALGGLAKIGARNSAKDKERIRTAHDALAEIDPAACGTGEDTGKAAVGELKKALDVQAGAFKTQMDEITPLLKDVLNRVKNIESQPLPEGTSHFTVVEKGLRGQGDDEGSQMARAERLRLQANMPQPAAAS